MHGPILFVICDQSNHNQGSVCVVFNKAIIDKNSLEIINGSVVNYKKEMIGSSFTIENPKAT